MRLTAIEAIIFDYGGVISTPPFSGIAEFELDQGYPTGSMLRLFLGVDGGESLDESAESDWHSLETGRLALAEYLERLVERAPGYLDGQPFDIEAYYRFSMEAPFGVHWMMVHRARSLRETGYRTAILTNNVAEWRPVWRSTFPVDDLFHAVVDSSEVGIRKPDPAIYLLTCERLGVDPKCSVFLDDNLANVEAARSLGMHTILVGPDPRHALAELDALLPPSGGRSAIRPSKTR